jgi:4-alpha-glucanotransferase
MHDILALGQEARLNAPSTVSGGNWTFRYILSDLKNKTTCIENIAEQKSTTTPLSA